MKRRKSKFIGDFNEIEIKPKELKFLKKISPKSKEDMKKMLKAIQGKKKKFMF